MIDELLNHPWPALILACYAGLFIVLAIFGAHRAWLLRLRLSRELPGTHNTTINPFDRLPHVLVQLPIFNERYVAPRLVRAVAALDYPHDRLEIQVLDDSTDDTPERISPLIERLQTEGINITHLRRDSREGYKAGALAWGLEHSDAEIIAIFDADFVPAPDFLKQTLKHFTDPTVGMVQARWGHLNTGYSALTATQAVMLDGHFMIEHSARYRSDCFFNFNGTAGLWRRRAIEEAGGWQHDTLTEDMDLSFRAQLRGWRFVYCEDVIAPAELPVTIEGFKSQQHRWTKGAMQTARKLLMQIWQAPNVPLRCKCEAGFQLLSNICYPLIALVTVLLLPACIARTHLDLPRMAWFDLPILAMTTVSIACFYWWAERLQGASRWQALKAVPAVMCLGLGMSFSNAWAVLDGLVRRGGEFVRTPKYLISNRKDRWRGKRYRVSRGTYLIAAESMGFLYCLLTAAYCTVQGMWLMLPFVGLFLTGFGWVAGLGLREHWGGRRMQTGILAEPNPGSN